MRRMKVNVEIGVAYGAPGGTWDTFWIEVECPTGIGDATLEDKALEIARKGFEAKPDVWVAHLWVHHVGEQACFVEETG